jgi:membrane associated rhomboid family serine protease
VAEEVEPARDDEDAGAGNPGEHQHGAAGDQAGTEDDPAQSHGVTEHRGRIDCIGGGLVGQTGYKRESVIPIRDTNPASRRPVITPILIAINVAVFAYEASLGDALDHFVYRWGLVPRHYSPETIATSMFLHGGLLHLLGNMWFLHIFGDNVEDRLGRLPYLVCYLGWGAAAGLAQVWTNPASSLPMVGASGAIAGVTGAYMIFFPRARVYTLLPLFVVFYTAEIPAAVFLALWFAMQLQGGCATYGAAGGGVAFWAHVGGFVAGAVVALVVLPFQRQKRWGYDEPRWI